MPDPSTLERPQPHVLHLPPRGVPVTIKQFETDGMFEIVTGVHNYPAQHEPIEVTVEPLSVIQSNGPEYAKQVARNVMLACFHEVSPISGFGEAALILGGLSRQRVHQLAEAGKMPNTVGKLMATRLWSTEELIVFALTRQKSVDPPKKNKKDHDR